jgi:hypothetical protein
MSMSLFFCWKPILYPAGSLARIFSSFNSARQAGVVIAIMTAMHTDAVFMTLPFRGATVVFCPQRQLIADPMRSQAAQGTTSDLLGERAEEPA